MGESNYRRQIKRRLEREFPGCIVIRPDPSDIQGIPDLLVLYGPRWAMLEVKMAADSPVQPNQPYYVRELNSMSYAAFIYPESEDRIFHELQLALRDRR